MARAAVPGRLMLRFVAFTWGMIGAWAWWVFAPKAGPVTVASGAALALATVVIAVTMARRARRMRSDHGHVNARLEYHAGMSADRWRRGSPARDDDGGKEMTLGSGW